MKGLKTASVALLLATVVGLQPAPAFADDHGRRDRVEDRRDRREDRWDRREDRYDRRNDRWDPVYYYRQDVRRYPPRRLGRADVIYRGSDNRYYCRRDDGTSGLIVGGITGGLLGNIIAPNGSKAVGTLLGAGVGAAIGQAADRGDIVCR